MYKSCSSSDTTIVVFLSRKDIDIMTLCNDITLKLLYVTQKLMFTSQYTLNEIQCHAYVYSTSRKKI